MAPDDGATAYRTIDQFTLGDLEAIRIVLGGGSVIDWHRLNFESDQELYEFLRVHEFHVENRADLTRIEAIKHEAIEYLRRNFEFPVPRSVQLASALELFNLARAKGHKQVCACIILKVMHIIHHLQGRELLVMLPMSDAEFFHLVEEKVYRVVGGMMTSGLPIVEFLGGRKNRDSLYTKLLSKKETIAAQIYDKLRFRIVTRTPADLFPVVNYLSRRLFPFNYVIPKESTNTLLDFQAYCTNNPRLRALLPLAQGGPLEDRESKTTDNVFSAQSYRVIHFVVDLPVRVPREVLDQAPPNAAHLGAVVFVLTEFQIVDQETESANEMGEASHARYKERQRLAVMERLRMGFRAREKATAPGELDDDATMEQVSRRKITKPAEIAPATRPSEPADARAPRRKSHPPRK